MAEIVRHALDRLVEAARTGELAALCRQHNIDLMVAFGSVLEEDSDPADLDLGVRFARHAERDLLTLLNDLYRLTRLEAIDLLVLNDAGPVARERAMVHGRLLYQAQPGTFANDQIAAIMQRMDTDRLRRLELELMSQ
jgi:predicted nucleotidyltransferase